MTGVNKARRRTDAQSRPMHAPTTPRRAPTAAHLVLTVLVSLSAACAPATGPGADDAVADSAATAPAEHVAALNAAVRRTPQDPQLRITLARAELASGAAMAAEGSLRRARALGATAEEVAVPLAATLIEQGRYDDALAVIGDPAQRPAGLRWALTLLAAEAALRMPNTDPRVTLERFVEVWRLREALAPGAIPNEERRELEARLEALRLHDPLVMAAYEHHACRAEAPAPLPAPSVASVAGTAAAQGRRILQVGPGRALARPSEAARIARDGDIVEIDAGDYPGDVALWTQDRLWLRGVGGRARLDARGGAALGQGIWVLRGAEATVENIEFSGARSPAHNGSGMRFLGRRLTVRHCLFRDNEAGLLTWNDPEGEVLVEHSVFSRNGHGDGQSHNIYVGRVRSFTLRYSHSHDARGGHAVKSRAAANRIVYNRLTDEENGDSSYLVDLPEGGDGYVIGNDLLKGARSTNPYAISYASERPAATSGHLWVVNNTFYNRRLDATFVRNRSELPVRVVNNVVAGAPATLKAGTVEVDHNHQGPDHGLTDGARLDFTPLPGSPLIDSGIEIEPIDGESLRPAFEYVHPASARPRQRVGPIDRGSREFCGG